MSTELVSTELSLPMLPLARASFLLLLVRRVFKMSRRGVLVRRKRITRRRFSFVTEPAAQKDDHRIIDVEKEQPAGLWWY